MKATPRRAASRLALAVACSACLVVTVIAAPTSVAAGVVNGRTIERITGDWPIEAHKEGARISGDGHLVAFTAMAEESPFAAPGSVGRQVYAIDLSTGAAEQISVDSDQQGYEGMAWAGGMSPDGRFVTFSDWQHPGTTYLDVYVRDRLLGITELISVAGDGGAADGYTQLGRADVSADGRFVVFSSTATNLIPGEVNVGQGVYLRDRVAATTTRLDAREDGLVNTSGGDYPEISDDGTTAIFFANDLLENTPDEQWHVYAIDLASTALELVSVSTEGDPGDFYSDGCSFDVSSDGRYVVFTSLASNLVQDDTNLVRDVFVRDRLAGTTVRASVTDADQQASQESDVPSISNDGTKVAFVYQGSLDSEGSSGAHQVYLRDLAAGTTTLISANASGVGGNSDSGYCGNTQGTDMDDAGSVIAFNSLATDLTDDPDPILGYFDVFVSRPAPADDGDGIDAAVDTAPGSASTAFSDGTTYGEIVTVPAGLSLSIADAADPAKGVRAQVTGASLDDVVVSVCGETVLLPAGSDVELTCGSVIVDVAPGSAPISVVIGGGLAVVLVPPGGSAEVSTGVAGAFSVQNVSGAAVTVTVDGVSTTVDPGDELEGTAWDFQGFASPIDNGTTFNLATAGKSLPLRWRLVGPSGTAVTNLATAKLTVTSLSCALGVTTDQVEEYVAGESGLLNLGHGTYQINWKTPKAYAGSCKTLHLDIGDGVLHDARIKFSK